MDSGVPRLITSYPHVTIPALHLRLVCGLTARTTRAGIRDIHLYAGSAKVEFEPRLAGQ